MSNARRLLVAPLALFALATSALASMALAGCDAGPTSESAEIKAKKFACAPIQSCDAALPDLGAKRGFRHVGSKVAAIQFANHRGRDMFYNPGDDVWVMAKFAYGLVDKDLEDEDIDIYLDRGCGADWEYVDTTRTSDGKQNPTVEGVADSGGRVFFKVPQELKLAPGRHRFELVVAGDLSHTSVYVDIVPRGEPIVVSDVDGTLTSSENAEFGALLRGSIPETHDGAPDVLQALADKGYRVMYLTARPEYLLGRTRAFLETHGFPPGIVHTTLTMTGTTGDGARAFKTAELQAIGKRGLIPSWGFGNRDSDAQTYTAIGIKPVNHCVLYQWDDPGLGCRRIESYEDLLGEVDAAPGVCK